MESTCGNAPPVKPRVGCDAAAIRHGTRGEAAAILTANVTSHCCNRSSPSLFDVTHPRRRRLRRFRAVEVVCTAALALGLFAASETALACDCGFAPETALPRGDEASLPRDSRFWLPSMFLSGGQLLMLEQRTPSDIEQTLVLLDSSGTSIPFSARRIVDHHDRLLYFMLTPNLDLQAGRYEVWDESTRAMDPPTDVSLGVPEPLAVALVSEPSATEPPRKPKIVQRAEFVDDDLWGATSSCGQMRAVVVDLEHDGAFTLVAINVAPTLEEEGEWQVSHMTSERSITFGSMACAPSVWDFEDGAARVQFAAMDLSGNVSEWTGVERVYAGSGCGCALPGRQGNAKAQTWSAALMALMVLSGIRRRARARRDAFNLRR